MVVRRAGALIKKVAAARKKPKKPPRVRFIGKIICRTGHSKTGKLTHSIRRQGTLGRKKWMVKIIREEVDKQWYSPEVHINRVRGKITTEEMEKISHFVCLWLKKSEDIKSLPLEKKPKEEK